MASAESALHKLRLQLSEQYTDHNLQNIDVSELLQLIEVALPKASASAAGNDLVRTPVRVLIYCAPAPAD